MSHEAYRRCDEEFCDTAIRANSIIMNQVALAEGIQFFPDTPILKRDEVDQRFNDWQVGSKVMSRLAVVGFISTTPEIANFVNSQAISDISYRLLYQEDDVSQHPVMHQIDAAFDTVVAYDKQRSGLLTEGERATFAGMSRWQRPRWHPDSHPFVRWALSINQESTWAVDGLVTRADHHHGRLDKMIESGVLIRQRVRPAGYVVRFMLGDIHTRPPGIGNRIFKTNTADKEDLYWA